LERRRPSWTWQAARILLAGSSDQAFLDHGWIGWLLDALPLSARRPVALRILGLSPHYFINQWTNAYPKGTKRTVVLDAEAERNRASRKQIVDDLLAPYLQPDMTVLDFGCGPGFLASQLAPHVRSVIAVDVSRGTIACARHLNAAANVAYLNNRSSDLVVVPDNSVDLAISFAVFQHLTFEQSLRFLEEFHRVLRPGGSAICQFAVATLSDSTSSDRTNDGSSFLDRYRLNFRMSSEDEVVGLIEKTGFSEILVSSVREVAEIADDVGAQHLAVFRRSPEAR
jgi:cyclopropane fatty-acyl-phospholipid synthase-like methyltransferase